MGGGGLNVAIMTGISIWFTPRERPIPIIIHHGLLQTGILLASLVQSRMLDYSKSIFMPFLLTLIFAVIGYISSVIYIHIENQLIKEGFIVRSMNANQVYIYILIYLVEWEENKSNENTKIQSDILEIGSFCAPVHVCSNGSGQCFI